MADFHVRSSRGAVATLSRYGSRRVKFRDLWRCPSEPSNIFRLSLLAAYPISWCESSAGGTNMVIPAYAGSLHQTSQRETALITGASTGIGLDFARLMARDFDLIITARDKARLEQVARDLEHQHGNRVDVIPADLAQPDAPVKLCAEIDSRSLRVDALINNAGFGTYGAFAN